MGKDLKGKELGKNLSQRKDGRYEAKYTDNYGKRHSIYGEKLSEVRKKLTDALYEVEHNIYNRNAKFTVDEWFEVYIKNCEAKNMKESSINIYKQYYQLHISPYIGYMSLQSVKQIHIQNMFAIYVDKYRLATQKFFKKILTGMFRLALDNDFVTKSPVRNIIMKSSIEDREKRFLTEEEQRLFLSYTKGEPYYPLFCLLMFTGCRIGEALALNWSDIDFTKKTISITKTLSETYDSTQKITRFYIDTPKTKTSNRQIPIHPFLLKVLERMGKSFDIVFPTINGGRIWSNSVRDAIKKTVDKINKDNPSKGMRYFSPHSFRHTFASNCFKAGVSPKIVQEFLGHSTMSMTMDLYTHVCTKTRGEAISKLPNIIP